MENSKNTQSSGYCPGDAKIRESILNQIASESLNQLVTEINDYVQKIDNLIKNDVELRRFDVRREIEKNVHEICLYLEVINQQKLIIREACSSIVIKCCESILYISRQLRVRELGAPLPCSALALAFGSMETNSSLAGIPTLPLRFRLWEEFLRCLEISSKWKEHLTAVRKFTAQLEFLEILENQAIPVPVTHAETLHHAKLRLKILLLKAQYYVQSTDKNSEPPLSASEVLQELIQTSCTSKLFQEDKERTAKSIQSPSEALTTPFDIQEISVPSLTLPLAIEILVVQSPSNSRAFHLVGRPIKSSFREFDDFVGPTLLDESRENDAINTNTASNSRPTSPSAPTKLAKGEVAVQPKQSVHKLQCDLLEAILNREEVVNVMGLLQDLTNSINTERETAEKEARSEFKPSSPSDDEIAALSGKKGGAATAKKAQQPSAAAGGGKKGTATAVSAAEYISKFTGAAGEWRLHLQELIGACELFSSRVHGVLLEMASRLGITEQAHKLALCLLRRIHYGKLINACSPILLTFNEKQKIEASKSALNLPSTSTTANNNKSNNNNNNQQVTDNLNISSPFEHFRYPIDLLPPPPPGALPLQPPPPSPPPVSSLEASNSRPVSPASKSPPAAAKKKGASPEPAPVVVERPPTPLPPVPLDPRWADFYPSFFSDLCSVGFESFWKSTTELDCHVLRDGVQPHLTCIAALTINTIKYIRAVNVLRDLEIKIKQKTELMKSKLTGSDSTTAPVGKAGSAAPTSVVEPTIEELFISKQAAGASVNAALDDLSLLLSTITPIGQSDVDDTKEELSQRLIHFHSTLISDLLISLIRGPFLADLLAIEAAESAHLRDEVIKTPAELGAVQSHSIALVNVLQAVVKILKHMEGLVDCRIVALVASTTNKLLRKFQRLREASSAIAIGIKSVQNEIARRESAGVDWRHSRPVALAISAEPHRLNPISIPLYSTPVQPGQIGGQLETLVTPEGKWRQHFVPRRLRHAYPKEVLEVKPLSRDDIELRALLTHLIEQRLQCDLGVLPRPGTSPSDETSLLNEDFQGESEAKSNNIAANAINTEKDEKEATEINKAVDHIISHHLDVINNKISNADSNGGDTSTPLSRNHQSERAQLPASPSRPSDPNKKINTTNKNSNNNNNNNTKQKSNTPVSPLVTRVVDASILDDGSALKLSGMESKLLSKLGSCSYTKALFYISLAQKRLNASRDIPGNNKVSSVVKVALLKAFTSIQAAEDLEKSMWDYIKDYAMVDSSTSDACKPDEREMEIRKKPLRTPAPLLVGRDMHTLHFLLPTGIFEHDGWCDDGNDLEACGKNGDLALHPLQNVPVALYGKSHGTTDVSVKHSASLEGCKMKVDGLSIVSVTSLTPCSSYVFACRYEGDFVHQPLNRIKMNEPLQEDIILSSHTRVVEVSKTSPPILTTIPLPITLLYSKLALIAFEAVQAARTAVDERISSKFAAISLQKVTTAFCKPLDDESGSLCMQGSQNFCFKDEELNNASRSSLSLFAKMICSKHRPLVQTLNSFVQPISKSHQTTLLQTMNDFELAAVAASRAEDYTTSVEVATSFARLLKSLSFQLGSHPFLLRPAINVFASLDGVPINEFDPASRASLCFLAYQTAALAAADHKLELIPSLFDENHKRICSGRFSSSRTKTIDGLNSIKSFESFVLLSAAIGQFNKIQPSLRILAAEATCAPACVLPPPKIETVVDPKAASKAPPVVEVNEVTRTQMLTSVLMRVSECKHDAACAALLAVPPELRASALWTRLAALVLKAVSPFAPPTLASNSSTFPTEGAPDVNQIPNPQISWQSVNDERLVGAEASNLTATVRTAYESALAQTRQIISSLTSKHLPTIFNALTKELEKNDYLSTSPPLVSIQVPPTQEELDAIAAEKARKEKESLEALIQAQQESSKPGKAKAGKVPPPSVDPSTTIAAPAITLPVDSIAILQCSAATFSMIELEYLAAASHMQSLHNLTGKQPPPSPSNFIYLDLELTVDAIPSLPPIEDFTPVELAEESEADPLDVLRSTLSNPADDKAPTSSELNDAENKNITGMSNDLKTPKPGLNIAKASPPPSKPSTAVGGVRDASQKPSSSFSPTLQSLCSVLECAAASSLAACIANAPGSSVRALRLALSAIALLCPLPVDVAAYVPCSTPSATTEAPGGKAKAASKAKAGGLEEAPSSTSLPAEAWKSLSVLAFCATQTMELLRLNFEGDRKIACLQNETLQGTLGQSHNQCLGNRIKKSVGVNNSEEVIPSCRRFAMPCDLSVPNHIGFPFNTHPTQSLIDRHFISEELSNSISHIPLLKVKQGKMIDPDNTNRAFSLLSEVGCYSVGNKKNNASSNNNVESAGGAATNRQASSPTLQASYGADSESEGELNFRLELHRESKLRSGHLSRPGLLYPYRIAVVKEKQTRLVPSPADPSLIVAEVIEVEKEILEEIDADDVERSAPKTNSNSEAWFVQDGCWVDARSIARLIIFALQVMLHRKMFDATVAIGRRFLRCTSSSFAPILSPFIDISLQYLLKEAQKTHFRTTRTIENANRSLNRLKTVTDRRLARQLVLSGQMAKAEALHMHRMTILEKLERRQARHCLRLTKVLNFCQNESAIIKSSIPIAISSLQEARKALHNAVCLLVQEEEVANQNRAVLAAPPPSANEPPPGSASKSPVGGRKSMSATSIDVATVPTTSENPSSCIQLNFQVSNTAAQGLGHANSLLRSSLIALRKNKMTAEICQCTFQLGTGLWLEGNLTGAASMWSDCIDTCVQVVDSLSHWENEVVTLKPLAPPTTPEKVSTMLLSISAAHLYASCGHPHSIRISRNASNAICDIAHSIINVNLNAPQTIAEYYSSDVDRFFSTPITQQMNYNKSTNEDMKRFRLRELIGERFGSVSSAFEQPRVGGLNRRSPLDALLWSANVQITDGLAIKALPAIVLAEHLAADVLKNIPLTLESRILRARALIKIGALRAASHELINVVASVKDIPVNASLDCIDLSLLVTSSIKTEGTHLWNDHLPPHTISNVKCLDAVFSCAIPLQVKAFLPVSTINAFNLAKVEFALAVSSPVLSLVPASAASSNIPTTPEEKAAFAALSRALEMVMPLATMPTTYTVDKSTIETAPASPSKGGKNSKDFQPPTPASSLPSLDKQTPADISGWVCANVALGQILELGGKLQASFNVLWTSLEYLEVRGETFKSIAVKDAENRLIAENLLLKSEIEDNNSLSEDNDQNQQLNSKNNKKGGKSTSAKMATCIRLAGLPSPLLPTLLRRKATRISLKLRNLVLVRKLCSHGLSETSVGSLAGLSSSSAQSAIYNNEDVTSLKSLIDWTSNTLKLDDPEARNEYRIYLASAELLLGELSLALKILIGGSFDGRLRSSAYLHMMLGHLISTNPHIVFIDGVLENASNILGISAPASISSQAISLYTSSKSNLNSNKKKDANLSSPPLNKMAAERYSARSRRLLVPKGEILSLANTISASSTIGRSFALSLACAHNLKARDILDSSVLSLCSQDATRLGKNRKLSKLGPCAQIPPEHLVDIDSSGLAGNSASSAGGNKKKDAKPSAGKGSAVEPTGLEKNQIDSLSSEIVSLADDSMLKYYTQVAKVRLSDDYANPVGEHAFHASERYYKMFDSSDVSEMLSIPQVMGLVDGRSVKYYLQSEYTTSAALAELNAAESLINTSSLCQTCQLPHADEDDIEFGDLLIPTTTMNTLQSDLSRLDRASSLIESAQVRLSTLLAVPPAVALSILHAKSRIHRLHAKLNIAYSASVSLRVPSVSSPPHLLSISLLHPIQLLHNLSGNLGSFISAAVDHHAPRKFAEELMRLSIQIVSVCAINSHLIDRAYDHKQKNLVELDLNLKKLEAEGRLLPFAPPQRPQLSTKANQQQEQQQQPIENVPPPSSLPRSTSTKVVNESLLKGAAAPITSEEITDDLRVVFEKLIGAMHSSCTPSIIELELNVFNAFCLLWHRTNRMRALGQHSFKDIAMSPSASSVQDLISLPLSRKSLDSVVSPSSGSQACDLTKLPLRDAIELPAALASQHLSTQNRCEISSSLTAKSMRYIPTATPDQQSLTTSTPSLGVDNPPTVSPSVSQALFFYLNLLSDSQILEGLDSTPLFALSEQKRLQALSSSISQATQSASLTSIGNLPGFLKPEVLKSIMKWVMPATRADDQSFLDVPKVETLFKEKKYSEAVKMCESILKFTNERRNPKNPLTTTSILPSEGSDVINTFEISVLTRTPKFSGEAVKEVTDGNEQEVNISNDLKPKSNNNGSMSFFVFNLPSSIIRNFQQCLLTAYKRLFNPLSPSSRPLVPDITNPTVHDSILAIRADIDTALLGLFESIFTAAWASPQSPFVARRCSSYERERNHQMAVLQVKSELRRLEIEVLKGTIRPDVLSTRTAELEKSLLATNVDIVDTSDLPGKRRVWKYHINEMWKNAKIQFGSQQNETAEQNASPNTPGSKVAKNKKDDSSSNINAATVTTPFENVESAFSGCNAEAVSHVLGALLELFDCEISCGGESEVMAVSKLMKEMLHPVQVYNLQLPALPTIPSQLEEFIAPVINAKGGKK